MTLDIIIQTYEHANHMSNKANMALPKLPPLPRKGNRTIYLANDELWERAKNLAGKEGLSSVIAKALADFVAQRDADQSSFQKFTFEILGDPHSEDPTEVGAKVQVRPVGVGVAHPGLVAGPEALGGHRGDHVGAARVGHLDAKGAGCGVEHLDSHG